VTERARPVLQWSLHAGAVYFGLVAVAHMIGMKLPVLYIYPMLPSYAYQDKLIAILSFGWALMIRAAARHVEREEIVRALLVAGAGAIAGLLAINLTTDLRALPPSDVRAIWAGFAGMLSYLVWLAGWYWAAEIHRGRER